MVQLVVAVSSGTSAVLKNKNPILAILQKQSSACVGVERNRIQQQNRWLRLDNLPALVERKVSIVAPPRRGVPTPAVNVTDVVTCKVYVFSCKELVGCDVKGGVESSLYGEVDI